MTRSLSRRVLLLAGCAMAFADRCGAAETFELNEISPGVLVHSPPVSLTTRANAGDICNISAVIGGDAIAVIDSGGSMDVASRFLKAIRARSDKPIRYVVNTHMHPDHIFGNAAFEAEGAVFVGHKNLPRAIASRREFYLSSYREQLGAELVANVKLLAPSLLVEDVMELDLGGRRIVLQAWPAAHTDNDLTIFDQMTATLFAGDLVFIGHVPILDGSLKGWLEIKHRLRAIPAKQVVPGHGPAPRPWPSALEPQDHYLTTLASDVRAAIEQGQSIAEAVKTVGRSERPGWQLFDDYHPRNATSAFSELEWE